MNIRLTLPVTGSIEPLPQKWRFGLLGLNLLLAWLAFFFASGSAIPTGSGASVWFLAASAYWVLTLIAAPFFIPPKDAVSNAIALVLLLAPVDFSSVPAMRDGLELTRAFALLLALIAGTVALVAAYNKERPLGRVAYRVSSVIGKGEIIFTPAVVISAIGFYQSSPAWMAAILGIWVFELAARPADLGLRLWRYFSTEHDGLITADVVGTVIRVDDPDIVRVLLADGHRQWKTDVVHFVRLPDGRSTYVLPLFVQVQNEDIVGTGLCCPASDDSKLAQSEVGQVLCIDDPALAARLGGSLSGEEATSKVAGIVAEGSTIGSIHFQVVRDMSLEEGMVVFAVVRGCRVYYQILDACTREERFQQNPFGVHVASAAQLGCFDEQKGFEKFPWLPQMNQPLFLVQSDVIELPAAEKGEMAVGLVPSTSFAITARLNELIEYHTAILGVTGTGKTELTFAVIRRALDDGAKIFCVDFTGEYKSRLADCKPTSIGVSVEDGSKLAELLFAIETGSYGAPNEKKALKDFLDGVRPRVMKDIAAFLENDDQQLGIFELAEITNTKATLRTTELFLSAIMDWAKQHRRARKILIVLEEAHTIIPENFGSGFDSETQWVVGRIGQIALQGRKYGVGLLVVSQRTALVSKTVLSQCNTFFTHCLIDKTSLDFLSSIYGPDHVRALPNLRFLEFLAHGKAINSDRPVLTTRPFDEAIADASRKLDSKPSVKAGDVSIGKVVSQKVAESQN